MQYQRFAPFSTHLSRFKEPDDLFVAIYLAWFSRGLASLSAAVRLVWWCSPYDRIAMAGTANAALASGDPFVRCIICASTPSRFVCRMKRGRLAHRARGRRVCAWAYGFCAVAMVNDYGGVPQAALSTAR
jgi:hypothetical protein